jgi:hypothetical protein
MHTAVRDNFSLNTMKTIASLVLATITLSIAPSIQAHNFGKKIIIHGHTSHHFCAPRYVVCTKELCRRIEWRCVYDSHGCHRNVAYYVVTYATFYSDGSRHSFTRTFRA